MPAITGLGHVALKVKDVERSLAFYRDVMQFPEMMRLHHDDGSLFLIYLRITDTQYLELFPDGVDDTAPGPDHTGMHHFCLTIDVIEQTVDQIVARGGIPCAWTTENGTSALRPVDKPVITDGLDGNRQSWLQDPDGNRIELMEMAPDCLQMQAIRKLKDM
ncbi:VOC family protein [Loktanella sp. SALINAS62]|uniref:VOC family protein n=1 Tax=Loktanella sp. SALINAS62 TaxID=2706124 RepID=UPI001B8D492F|nr:VOC family protein [Loktanella sp. SALINAS62]MBS1301236.1 VOC family protein [Loktanella sp. SALINAS62]